MTLLRLAIQSRPEYVALAGELAFLREAFALPCSDIHCAEVCATLGAFECIDRYYDAERDGLHRRALGADVVRVIAGGEPASPLPPELVEHLHRMREVFRAHAAIAQLVDRLVRFVEATERVRTTLDLGAYVGAVVHEGRLTSEMVLLLFDGDPAHSRFCRFFLCLGVVGNLVDKLCDVRADFSRGEIALRPSPVVYARLVVTFVRHAMPLLAQFPRPTALVVWGAKYFAPLLRPTDHTPRITRR